MGAKLRFAGCLIKYGGRSNADNPCRQAHPQPGDVRPRPGRDVYLRNVLTFVKSYPMFVLPTR